MERRTVRTKLSAFISWISFFAARYAAAARSICSVASSRLMPALGWDE